VREIIFLDGNFIPRKGARVSALAPGLLYGWGLFETMRAGDKGIIYFDEHIRRLRDSAQLLQIPCPYNAGELKKIIRRLVKINGIRDANIRITLWKAEEGSSMLVIAKNYQPYSAREYKKGLRAWISSFRQFDASGLSRLKSTNYLLYKLALAQALKKGFDEALLINHKGYIAQGARSNLFFIKDKELFTPSLECGCLEGITRKAVFDLARRYKIKIYAGNFTLQDLYSTESAFLTNSLMGIMPLSFVEGRRIGKAGAPHKLIVFLVQKYKSLIRK
jgi:branched-subunit amino acid aminotransferase/4-amino-4-deoxychorismate lyase